MNTNNVGSSGGSGAPPMPKLKAVPVQTHNAKKGVFEMNPQYSKVTGKGGASLVVDADKAAKKDHLTLTGPRKEQLESIRQPSGPLLTSIHSSRHDNQNGNEFNLFTHQKLTQSQRVKMENHATLKEALLELYLSVKIRSDDEIDNYTEEQFKVEKAQMRQVDGFTLIDYIKSSIEILMNMKIDDNGGPGGEEYYDHDYDELDEHEAEERRRRKKERKEAKKRKQQEQAEPAETGGPNKPPKPIPKIDDRSPSSSIIDLQQKLDQISSPNSVASSSSSELQSASSIPHAHREYERALRQLEQECRNHIKVEQQMKLHIEVLQEKVESLGKERDQAKKDMEKAGAEARAEAEKLTKIVKTLEEELTSKAERIKA